MLLMPGWAISSIDTQAFEQSSDPATTALYSMASLHHHMALGSKGRLLAVVAAAPTKIS